MPGQVGSAFQSEYVFEQGMRASPCDVNWTAVGFKEQSFGAMRFLREAFGVPVFAIRDLARQIIELS